MFGSKFWGEETGCEPLICLLHVNPWKIIGWNMRWKSPVWKGKSSEPNLCDFGFKMLIFQGVTWFIFADHVLLLWLFHACSILDYLGEAMMCLKQTLLMLVDRRCCQFSKVLVTLTYLYLPQVYVFTQNLWRELATGHQHFVKVDGPVGRTCLSK